MKIKAYAKINLMLDILGRLPNGYHTVINEDGGNLSQGQKQLISFARTLLSDPAILVLDEATAHIDTNTEELIQKSIENISKGRTSIFIAHRLSTIQNCDIIFVLDDGQVAEQGTHEQLLDALLGRGEACSC